MTRIRFYGPFLNVKKAKGIKLKIKKLKIKENDPLFDL